MPSAATRQFTRFAHFALPTSAVISARSVARRVSAAGFSSAHTPLAIATSTPMPTSARIIGNMKTSSCPGHYFTTLEDAQASAESTRGLLSETVATLEAIAEFDIDGTQGNNLQGRVAHSRHGARLLSRSYIDRCTPPVGNRRAHDGEAAGIRAACR